MKKYLLLPLLLIPSLSFAKESSCWKISRAILADFSLSEKVEVIGDKELSFEVHEQSKYCPGGEIKYSYYKTSGSYCLIKIDSKKRAFTAELCLARPNNSDSLAQ